MEPENKMSSEVSLIWEKRQELMDSISLAQLNQQKNPLDKMAWTDLYDAITLLIKNHIRNHIYGKQN